MFATAAVRGVRESFLTWLVFFRVDATVEIAAHNAITAAFAR
jgi:hypothetical protein